MQDKRSKKVKVWPMLNPSFVGTSLRWTVFEDVPAHSDGFSTLAQNHLQLISITQNATLWGPLTEDAWLL